MIDTSEVSGEVEPFLPSFPTVDSFSQSALRNILLSTKHSNQLPGDKRVDWDYYSTFPAFRNVMQAENTALRSMLRSQLEYNNIKARLSTTDVSELVEILSDANDTILERVNIALDEAAGIRKEADPLLLEVSQKNISRISGSWNNFTRGRGNENVSSSPTSPAVKLLAAKNVVRPQLKFSKFIDNSEKTPFIPRLEDKPHALKPLSILVEYEDGDGAEYYSHPYLFEMERLVPSEAMLAITVPIKPPSVEESELVMVETVEQLRIAVQELSMQEVIGVDLEHHNYRSYQGITCLIQISTFNKDFLIDPLLLWADLPLLNDIMANPKIVKVLHGCDSDVEWLQRDFSVYLVNVFDTHQAGKLLGLPRLSLAWLLQNYCALEVDKKFQLADWRIRPLPAEMVLYARQDTRYLGYLYSRLKNELISKGNESSNLLQSCLHQSQDLAKLRYHKPRLHPESHLQLVRKARASLNNRQLFAVKQLYAWRDKVARVEDESTNYVLPNHMLLKIGIELPREMQGILACCNPVPPLVKQNLGLLHQVVLAARDKQVQAVEVVQELEREQGRSEQVDLELLENPLESPLDLSHFSDSGQLDSVVTPDKKKTTTRFTWANNNLVKNAPDLTVFDRDTSHTGQKIVKFVSPYQRFIMLKPYLDSLKEDQESSDDVKGVKKQTENIRMESIMKHFAQLTEMTPKKVAKKVIPEEEDDEEEVEEVGSGDEDVEPKKPYFPDPSKPYKQATERIPNLREGAQAKKKDPSKKSKGGGGGKGSGACFKCDEEGHFARECTKPGGGSNETGAEQSGNRSKTSKKDCYSCGVEGHIARDCKDKKKPLKRKSEGVSEGGTGTKVVKTEQSTEAGFDYKNVDFKNFGKKGGGANGEGDFDPSKQNKGKKGNGKGGGGGKQKQKFKNGGKSFTFNKQ